MNRSPVKRSTTAIAVIMLLLLLTQACGHESFTDGSTPGQSLADTKPTPSIDSVPNTDGVNSINWLWSCDSTTGKEGDNTGAVTLRGGGNYRLNAQSGATIPVKFSGSVCSPLQAPRDVVFVIDVSGSMGNNDPIVGSSCGRLDAVNAMLASIPSTADVRFGIVTFSTEAKAVSAKMQSTPSSLFQDVLASTRANSVVDILCAHATGLTGTGTNFDEALMATQTLISADARANASREIIFVSDGQPTGGNDGVEVAQALRDSGVTIGAVMLNGNDRVMQSKIASKDLQGVPLYTKVTNANQLGQAFAKVSKNDIVSAELRYRAVGAANFAVVNLLSGGSNLQFDLPPINVAVEDVMNGLEVVYDYADSRNKHYTSQGVITWTQVP